MAILGLLQVAAVLIRTSPVLAGPPFITDDPEPVDLHHWEVYISSIEERSGGTTSGTLPHVEVNYGPAPDVQLHIIAPCAFSHSTGGGPAFGYGDTELGVKCRFVHETRTRPMVGMFPLLEVPTGSPDRGLGTGHLQVFVPLWLQKSWGPWTSFGGGGYFVNPGRENRDYWLAGWEVQKDLSAHLTLGGEVYYTTPDSVRGSSDLAFNLGGQYNLDSGHHILFSAGRSIHGDTDFTGYFGFQWTFGPHHAGSESAGGRKPTAPAAPQGTSSP